MKIGLVLGGGFAKGAAQCGFLKGLFEYLDRDKITMMSGSSIGALNALAVSKNTLDKMENLYHTLDLVDIKSLRKELKNRFVDKVLNEILDSENNLDIPIYITGTSIATLSTHYFYVDDNIPKKLLYDTCNIAVTFPFVNGIFTRRCNHFYIDGGSTDNIPTLPFKTHKVDLLLILHAYPKYLPPLDIVTDDTVVIDVDVTAKCDKMYTYSFKHDNLVAMYDWGYKYGCEFASRVFKDMDLKNIKLRGQEFIREGLELRRYRKSTLTAAVFFNKLNQVRRIRE